MNSKQEKCPHCGEENNVLAAQQGYANVTPVGKIFTMKEQSLYHIVCLNCGTIIRSYVEQPQKLVVKKKTGK